MSDRTGIEWTDATWNPVTGCNKVSAGCKNCYAETMALRLQKMGSKRYANAFQLAEHPDALDIPRRWRRHRKIFVNSMSDLLHDGISDEFFSRVLNVIQECPQHVFQVLTKRADRLEDIEDRTGFAMRVWPENAWVGVTAENQDTLDDRLRWLKNTEARVRFLSCEPLLGPLKIDFSPSIHGGSYDSDVGIHWMIVGGESGPNARPMNPDWVRDIRDQCVAADVPFFFKQWGGARPKSNGSELDGRQWKQFPKGYEATP